MISPRDGVVLALFKDDISDPSWLFALTSCWRGDHRCSSSGSSSRGWAPPQPRPWLKITMETLAFVRTLTFSQLPASSGIKRLQIFDGNAESTPKTAAMVTAAVDGVFDVFDGEGVW